MATNFPDFPVAAECYPFKAADTMSGFGTGDAGGSFALANLKDPVLMQRGRTTSAVVDSGFDCVLDTAIPECFGLEVLELVTGEPPGDFGSITLQVVILDSGSTNVFDNFPGGKFVPSGVFTAYTASGLLDDTSVRSNYIGGYDVLRFALPSTPGVLNPVEAKTVRIQMKVGGGTDFWEFAYLALMVNAKQLEPIDPAQVETQPIDLRHGSGYRTTCRWSNMPLEDAEFLSNLWKRSASGRFPAFFYPAPGKKNAAGELVELEQNMAMRGGLVRMSQPQYRQGEPLGGVQTAWDVSLTTESWQETPAL